MKTNHKTFDPNKKLYAFFANFILDGSGRCNLEFTDDIDYALKHSGRGIFEVSFKEIETTLIEEETVMKVKRRKVVGYKISPTTPNGSGTTPVYSEEEE